MKKQLRAAVLAVATAILALISPASAAETEAPEVARLVALMERESPSSKACTAKDGVCFPGWRETAEERAARYRAIATAAWEVTGEEGVRLLFTGQNARLQTAAAILGVAAHESAFAKDVDIGPCYRGKGQAGRCDGGRAHCMMQIQLTHRGKSMLGKTGAELFADRKKCFREGLAQLVASQLSCAHKDWGTRFGIYASGTCRGGDKTARELANYVDTWSLRVLRKAAS